MTDFNRVDEELQAADIDLRLSLETYSVLTELWKSFPADNGGRMPLVPIFPKPGRVLFMGLNPSFSPKAIRKLVPELDTSPEQYFSWENRESFDPRIDLLLHVRAKSQYPYFARFREISTELGWDWDHTDLLYVRETSQALLKKSACFKKGGPELARFGSRQACLTADVLGHAEPACIVVANALASQAFHLRFQTSFSEDLGCYLYHDVPVFFTSMLTGQRALDRFSVERLAWHIGHVLRNGGFAESRS